MSDTSAMLFFVVILMIFLVIMAYVTRARIYHLLSIAPMMYITFSYIDTLSIVVLMIGLILYQLYLTIRSD